MTEGHHYISQFYLRYFSPKNRKGMIWVYSNENPQLRSIKKHVAKIDNFYTIDKEDGKSNIIEKLFSEMETLTARVIKKISNFHFELSKEEMDTLIIFISYLRARIPATRDSIDIPIKQERKLMLRILAENEEFFNKEMKDALKNENDNLNLSHSEFKDYVDNNMDKIDLGMNQNESIMTLQVVADSLKKMFFQMHWIFLRAPENIYFMTSDRPVFPFMNNWKQPYLPGFGYKDVEVYFPVTPQICMMGTYKKLNIQNHKIIDVDMVNVINSRILNNCYNYYYSNINSEELSKQIKITSDKYKNTVSKK